MRVSYSKCAASVVLALNLLTPLHAQVAADCSPIRVALSNRINYEYSRVDAVATSVASDVARAKSCVDSLLEQINSMIPSFGGGILGDLIGSVVGGIASGTCQLIRTTTNEAVSGVNQELNGVIPGSGVIRPPSANQSLSDIFNPAASPGGGTPSVVGGNATPTQGAQQQSQTVWQRALSAVW